MQIAAHDRTRIRHFSSPREISPIESAVESESSNQNLVNRWQAGDEFAARILVDRYMARLTALARANLSRRLARRLDPEDIVLSAWRSFFVATRGGRIEVPADDELWPLLLTLTLRKLRRQVARHEADKRSVNDEGSDPLGPAWIEVVSRDPTPEEAALAADQLESLLQDLSDSDREIVVHRLQGWTNPEIAERLGVSERTIGRAIQRIREHAAVLLDEPESSGGTPVASPLERLRPQQKRDASKIDIAQIDERDLLVQKFIGQGAFGKVYRALDRRTGQTVAVKFLSKKFWRHAAALESFESEMVSLSRICHPHIVAIHASGRTSAGAPFFVMEYVDGMNLLMWSRTQSPSVAEIVAVAEQTAHAVAAAHARNIIHGDLTPSNVLRETATGRVVLTDFGFSRITHQQRLAIIGGTPGFLAPEQVSDAFGEVSFRTDIYGIGGILYALLTGEPPSTGATLPDIIARVVSSRPPSFPDGFRREIPTDLAALTLACLAKEPANRPASADSVAERLCELVQPIATARLERG
jgi:RNA polymerase sigma factor (sigma-70 family)